LKTLLGWPESKSQILPSVDEDVQKSKQGYTTEKMLHGTATLENNLTAPQIIKCRVLM
jgi:hypothetical protein